MKDLIERLVLDFARLDRKYGNDWTEWQDVRDDIAALQKTDSGVRDE